MLLQILISIIHCSLEEGTDQSQPLKVYDKVYGFEVGKSDNHGVPTEYANGKEIGAGYDNSACPSHGILKTNTNDKSDSLTERRRVYIKGITIKCGDKRTRREIDSEMDLPINRKAVTFGKDEILEFVSDRDIEATVVPKKRKIENPSTNMDTSSKFSDQNDIGKLSNLMILQS